MKNFKWALVILMIFSNTTWAIPQGHWVGLSSDNQDCKLEIVQDQNGIIKITDYSYSENKNERGAVLTLGGISFQKKGGEYFPMKKFDREFFNRSRIKITHDHIEIEMNIFYKNKQLGLPDYLKSKLFVEVDTKGEPIGYGRRLKEMTCRNLKRTLNP